MMFPHGLRECYFSATCVGWRIQPEVNRISKSRYNTLSLYLRSGCRNYCYSTNVTYIISRDRKLRTSSPWHGARLMYTPWRAFSDTPSNYAAPKPKPPSNLKPLAPKPLFGARTPQTPAIVKPTSRVRTPQDPRAILAQTLTPAIAVPDLQDEPPLEERILQHRKTQALSPELLGPAIGTLWDQIEFDEAYSERLQLLDAQIAAAAAAAQDSQPLEIPTFTPSPADLEIDMSASADMLKLEPIEEREVELVDLQRDIKRLIKRVRKLQSRFVDIRYNIIMHDIAVTSFFDTVLKRLYHDGIYVARVRELTRFWNSIEVSVRKRRRAYLDSQSWLSKVNSKELRDISFHLKYLGELPRLPRTMQSIFSKYNRLLGMDKRIISLAGHMWRKYLGTGLYLSEHASVPNAWNFEVLSTSTSDAFIQYRNTISDTIDEINNMIGGLLSRPQKRSQRAHNQQLLTMLENSLAVHASAKNDLCQDFGPFYSYALYLFYSRQPTSSIYWKQWEVISPFITSRALILSIRGAVSDVLNVLDIGKRAGHRIPIKLEDSLWKWYREFPILWMDEFIVELEAFIELNFLRLQTEERLSRLDLNVNASPSVVFPNQTDMEKLRNWALGLERITGPGNNFTLGDSEVDTSRKVTDSNRWLRIQHGVWDRGNSPTGSRSTTPTAPRSLPSRLNNTKGLRRSGIRSKPPPPPSKPTKVKSKSHDTSPKLSASQPAKRKSESVIRSKAGTVSEIEPLVAETTSSLVREQTITTSKKKPSQWLNGLFNRVPFSKYHTKTAVGVSGSSTQTSNGQADPSQSKYWSYNLNKTPDGKEITVHYCTSLQTMERVAKLFLSETIVGLDVEWKAQASAQDSLVDNVSVIQLASKERIAIFHLALFNPANSLQHLLSPTLKRILESPDIVKVGVAIRADCTRLYKFLGIRTNNICEVSRLHKVVKHHLNPKLIDKRLVNLAQQVEEHLGLPLDKDPEIRCGGWSKKLNYRQVQYVATDPYAALQLFHVLEAKRLQLTPVPPSPVNPVIVYTTPDSIAKIHPKSSLTQNEEPPRSV
ncbi:3'-5' exonuclease/helicase [Histoplasma capsulatum G186AR]|uniref:3'-5' exonuclease/helicase n=1 Tax=Ajellomyces capsulatus TaxID=5037 RepID=A0A8H7YKY6_AJECA|nr:3'-5' exonuclease/helicase [Histoplasma capsulatum]QSS68646.1 3'-5' exonuclease/helicase [Histoplasma capsulatum G186AR]